MGPLKGPYTYYHNDTPPLYSSPGQLKDENASMKAQLDSVSSVSPFCILK